MQRSRIAAAMIAVLGIVGIGVGVAAAGGGKSADAPGQVKKTTTTTEPTTTTTGQATPASDVEGQDGQGVVRSTEGCNGGTYRNHGEFVKTVARTPGRTAAEVVAAAQSPCGKPIGATDEKSEGAGAPQGPPANPGQGVGGPPEEHPGQGTPGGPQGQGGQGHGPPADKPGRGPK